MLYSQNEALYSACLHDNVSEVSELLSRGAHVNYSDPDYGNVSIVSGHMT